MWARRRIVPIATLVALLATACSPGGGNAGAFAERLELIPASVAATVDDQPLHVAMADLDRAAELAGVERPDSSTDTDTVLEYANTVTGTRRPAGGEVPVVAALAPQAAGIERIAQIEEFREEVGWSIADVSWFVEYQVPPETFAVLGGDFDEARLTSAMGDPEDGIWRLGGEDGTQDVANTTAARPLGQSLRLALDDDQLVVGQTTPPVEQALTNDGDTLADNDVLHALAVAMDGEDAYSGLLLAGGDHSLAGALGTATPEQREQVANMPMPEVFQGVAGGVTTDGEDPIVVFVYIHDDAAAAEANAEALRRLVEEGTSLQNDEPWADRFKVDDIRTDGSTLVARLAPGVQCGPARQRTGPHTERLASGA